MTDQTTTTTDQDDEFFDDTTVDFPAVKHLAPGVRQGFGDGRLVAIWALSNHTGKGNNGPYDYTESITLALDDGPNGDQHNDMVGPAPFRVPMRHSTGYIQTKLKDRVDGVSAKGVPLRFRPLIGRVNTQASKNNADVAAFGLEPKADSDTPTVMKYKDLIVSINKELEAKATKAEDDSAFE